MTPKNSEIPKAAAKPRKRVTKKELAQPSHELTQPSYELAQPSHEEIARLAERYWAERGWPHGSPEEDWLRAERELRGKAS